MTQRKRQFRKYLKLTEHIFSLRDYLRDFLPLRDWKGSRGGSVVRALASHQCGLGSSSNLDKVDEEPPCGFAIVHTFILKNY